MCRARPPLPVCGEWLILLENQQFATHRINRVTVPSATVWSTSFLSELAADFDVIAGWRALDTVPPYHWRLIIFSALGISLNLALNHAGSRK